MLMANNEIMVRIPEPPIPAIIFAKNRASVMQRTNIEALK